MVDTDGKGYDYVGSLIYRRNGDELQLESATFGGGRIIASEGSNGNVYTPNYYITDHLGSTRAIVNADGTVIERNDYYPFGGKHENPQLIVSDNRFGFSALSENKGKLCYYEPLNILYLKNEFTICDE